jgi:Cellulose binding domain
MGFTQKVWIPSSALLVLWACATSQEIASDGAGTGGRIGTSNSGGAFGLGGASLTGGAFGLGGAPGLGGASNGGASNGGAASGGASNGGASSGGANNGGTSAEGGAAEAGAGGGGGVPASVLANASVILYYATNQIAASTNKIHMQLFLQNKSADPLPMADVTIRYWMTSEVASPVLHNYYSGPFIVGQSQVFVADGANSYAELTFTGSTIAQGADLNASEMQLDLDGGTFDQSDDWSFAPTLTVRTPHDKVTVYLGSKLIWGCEPSGVCAGDGAGGAGGAGGADGAAGAPGDLGGGGGVPNGGAGSTLPGGGVAAGGIGGANGVGRVGGVGGGAAQGGA